MLPVITGAAGVGAGERVPGCHRYTGVYNAYIQTRWLVGWGEIGIFAEFRWFSLGDILILLLSINTFSFSIFSLLF